MARQAEPKWHKANGLLSDHHGVWCAWCLEYIRRNAANGLELHHVLGFKKEIQKKLGFEPWVVPVHEDFCHREPRGLQIYSNDVARKLLNASKLSDDEIENRSQQIFHHGSHSVSMLLSGVALRKAISSKDMARRHANLLNTLSSAAGSTLGLSFVEIHQTESTRRSSRSRFGWEEMALPLWTAGVYQNAGYLNEARDVYNEFSTKISRVRPASTALRSKLVRMSPFVTPDLGMAEEAVRMSKDSSDPVYHGRTALIELAFNFELLRKYPKAREQAERLADGFGAQPPAWSHYIGYVFMLGRLILLAESGRRTRAVARRALKELVRSQYAGALLGYAGNPVPDYAEGGQYAELKNWTATDEIHRIGAHHRFSEEELTAIRREAIFEERQPPSPDEYRAPLGFQKKLFHSLLVGIQDQ